MFFKVEGRGDFVLKEKLRLLKLSLKRWSVEVFGWIDLKMNKTLKVMNDLNYQVSNSDCANIDEIALKRELASAGVWNQLNMKEFLLR